MKKLILAGILLFSLSVQAQHKPIKNSLGVTHGIPTLLNPLNGATFGESDSVLVWQKVPGALTYRIQIATDISFTTVVADTVCDTPALPALQYFGTRLNAGEKYFWRVNAMNSNGVSSYSRAWSFIPKYTFGKRVRNQLDSTFKWFRNNPPMADGSNFQSRWEKTALLDKFGWQTSNKTWNLYRSYWIDDPIKVSNIGNSNPILYYPKLSFCSYCFGAGLLT